jgi:hypothetical protein
MPETNVQTLVTAGVLPAAYLDIQTFLDEVNSLTPQEVQALIDLRQKVEALQIAHEGGADISAQFC